MKLKFAVLGACALALTACARPEPAPPVTLEPSFDKLGKPICPPGYQASRTETGTTVCAPTS